MHMLRKPLHIFINSELLDPTCGFDNVAIDEMRVWGKVF